MIRRAFAGCAVLLFACGGNASGDGDRAGSTAGGSTAAEQLEENADTLCAESCEKAAECYPDGMGSGASCEEYCLDSLHEAGQSEECAELMLAALECMAAADCADLDASCDRSLEEASRCTGGGGRTCSSGLPESSESPSAGDFACSQGCEATSTQPAQSVECVHAQAGFACTCTEDGAAAGEVEADSCERAYELCFR